MCKDIDCHPCTHFSSEAARLIFLHTTSWFSDMVTPICLSRSLFTLECAVVLSSYSMQTTCCPLCCLAVPNIDRDHKRFLWKAFDKSWFYIITNKQRPRKTLFNIACGCVNPHFTDAKLWFQSLYVKCAKSEAYWKFGFVSPLLCPISNGLYISVRRD